MTYDIDFRYRLALQPEALTTVQTTLAAIDAAISDARNAGLDPETDPAVALIARRIGRIASGSALDLDRDEDAPLRRACLQRIGALAGNPVIVVLARRGVGHDRSARDAFVRDVRAHLEKLAAAFDASEIPNFATPTDFSDRMEIVLTTPSLFVRVTTDLPRPGSEIDYGRNDRAGARSRTADISELLDPVRFARDIRRQLDFAPALPLISADA